MEGTARKILSNSLSSLFLKPFSSSSKTLSNPRVFLGFKQQQKQQPFSTINNSTVNNNPIMERTLRLDIPKSQNSNITPSFKDLGLSDEIMVAVKKMKIWGPTGVLRGGIQGLLEGNDVFISTNPPFESDSMFAYLLPIIQLLRRDEATLGIAKRRYPRAVVLCPATEVSDKVSTVTKNILHYVRGGDGSALQDVSFHLPIGLVAGTPISFLHEIEKGEFAYDDIKYLVLEDANTMLEIGYGPYIRMFLDPLVELATRSDDRVLQRAIVISPLTEIVSEEDIPFAEQKLMEYFQANLPELF